MPRAGRRILIVEDDPRSRRATADSFSETGWVVHSSATAAEAFGPGDPIATHRGLGYSFEL